MMFIIGWNRDNWHKIRDNRHIRTLEQLEEVLEGRFTTESIILHQEPSVTEVVMICRVEKVGFWKIDFRHCVYFRSVNF